MPLLQVFKCVSAGDAVSEEHTVSSLVKDLGDRLERLLPCSVPNLQLKHMLLLQLYHQRTELHPYCHLVVHDKFVRGDSVHQAAFAHA